MPPKPKTPCSSLRGLVKIAARQLEVALREGTAQTSFPAAVKRWMRSPSRIESKDHLAKTDCTIDFLRSPAYVR